MEKSAHSNEKRETDETMSKMTYEVTPEDRQIQLRDLLKRRLGLSTRLLRKLKDQNGIVCAGKVALLHQRFEPGDVITVNLPEETSYFEPEDIPIQIVYEDDALLVLNKQPGVVVHPTKGHQEHTIANGLMKHMADRGESYKIRFVNRLDMGTSGLLLVGKNSHCQDGFTRQAQEGRVIKEYLAVVHGLVIEDESVIDLPIGMDQDGPRRMVLEGGHPSVTRYRRLEWYASGYSLVRLILETGRTHQIRVHMAHLGHPLVGDQLYGAGGEIDARMGRQALHAARLAFFHPVTGERLDLEAPLPADMKDLLSRIETIR